jgi:hypothetical protein
MAKEKDRDSTTERFKRALRRMLNPRRPEPEHPDDPYALVGAPKKPRPPLGSLAVAVDPDKDF